MLKEDFYRRFPGWDVPGTTSPFMVKGEWAVHEVLEHLAEKGPLDVRIATISISADSLNPLYLLVDDGKVRKLRFLLDFSCRKNKLDRLLFAFNFATEVRMDKNHAKILLVESGDFRFGLVGSANLNLNNRWECGVFFNAGEMYDYFSGMFDKAYGEAMLVGID